MVMKENQKESLERINGLLEQIKDELNQNWGPDSDAEHPEVVLLIEQKKKGMAVVKPEDIADVHDMKMLSR
jgi:hypothetical protein